jgi:hypothetical protein
VGLRGHGGPIYAQFFCSLAASQGTKLPQHPFARINNQKVVAGQMAGNRSARACSSLFAMNSADTGKIRVNDQPD